MRRALATILATGFLLVWPSSSASACSCLSRPAAQRLAFAALVFEGVSIDYRGRWFSNDVDWAFEITQPIKSPPAGSVVVVRADKHGASCGSSFTIGQRYRVYAGTGTGIARTGLCSQNELLAGGPGPSAAREFFSPWPMRAAIGGVLAVFIALFYAVRVLKRARVSARIDPAAGS